MEVCVPIPSFFACPISLDLMRDPVIVSTGMTYDRSSIEKWLQEGHNTCPVTNQVVTNHDLIPNHTLRRLIRDWSAGNLMPQAAQAAAGGEESIIPPTPYSKQQQLQPEVSKSAGQVGRLLRCMINSFLQYQTLKKLQSLARDNAVLPEAAGVAVPVAAAAAHGDLQYGDLTMHHDSRENVLSRELIQACEDALGAIARLTVNDCSIDSSCSRVFAGDQKSLAACLQWLISESSGSSLETKMNAVEVLHKVAELDGVTTSSWDYSPARTGVIQGLVSLLKEEYLRIRPKAIQASLKCLLALCSLPRRNRIAAVEAGAVGALVELLPNITAANWSKCYTEHALALLEILASCAEGCEEMRRHQLAIPVIVERMVGISSMATEHAVLTLWAVLSLSSDVSRASLHTALQAGAFTKILLLLQSQCTMRTKAKAAELLKLLDEAWKDSPCRPNRSELRLIQMFRNHVAPNY